MKRDCVARVLGDNGFLATSFHNYLEVIKQHPSEYKPDILHLDELYFYRLLSL